MGWFDSDYETHVSWESSRMIQDTGRQYHNSIIAASISHNSENQGGFYPNYASQVIPLKQTLRQAYNYAKNGVYPKGIPDIQLSAASASTGSLLDSIRTEFGFSGAEGVTILGQQFGDIPLEVYYSHDLAYNDVDGDYDFNTQYATYDDDQMVNQTDWRLDSFVDKGDGTHDVILAREVDALTYWIEGPSYVVEGKTREFTIQLNRPLAADKTIVFDFDMQGDGVNGVDYVTPGQVTINGGQQQASFNFQVLDNSVTVDHVIQMGLTVVSGLDAYEQVLPKSGREFVPIEVRDRNKKTLTVPTILASEYDSTVDVKITSELASSAFTVDVYTISESAVQGEDFEYKEETLSFSGVAGETKTFIVDLLPDTEDDDFASFRIGFRNCSDPTIDISDEGIITITDGTSALPPTTDYLYKTLNKPSPPSEAGFFVLFTHDSAVPAGKYEQFLYYPSTNTYPALTNGAIDITLEDVSFPVIDLRDDHTDVDSDKNSNLYKKTRLTMAQMNMVADDIIEAYRSDSESNSIDEAYFNLRVPTGESTAYVSEALYRQFDYYCISNGMHLSSYAGELKRVRNDKEDYTKWSRVSFYADEAVVKTTEGKYFHEEGTYQPVVSPVTNTVYSISGVNLTMYFQKSATHCDVIEIIGLYNQTMVDATSWLNNADREWAFKKTWDDITIPMSWSVIKDIPPFQLVELYPYIYRLDITSAVVVETKWYQKSWFKVFLQIVQIVLMILYPPAGALINILLRIVVQYAITIAISYLIRALGVDPAIVAAIATVAAVMFAGVGGGSGSGFLDAENLLKIATTFADYMVQAANEMAQKLQEEFEDFSARADAAEEEIETAREELFLGSAAVLSPGTAIALALESSYDYDMLFDYDRILSNYHDNMMKIGIV